MTFIADTVFKGFSGGAPAATEEEQDIFLFPLDPAPSTASQLSLYSPGNGLSWLKGLHTFNQAFIHSTDAHPHAHLHGHMHARRSHTNKHTHTNIQLIWCIVASLSALHPLGMTNSKVNTLWRSGGRYGSWTFPSKGLRRWKWERDDPSFKSSAVFTDGQMYLLGASCPIAAAENTPYCQTKAPFR